MKQTSQLLILTFLFSFLASCGEDRSGEQPFAPTVENDSAIVVADSALLYGKVTESPNSSLKECGFVYGNDTLKLTTAAAEAVSPFVAGTDTLEAGTYYAVAYARNGIGTSYAPDTLYFTIQ